LTPYLVLGWNVVAGTGILWTGLSLLGVVMVSAATIKTCDELGLGRKNACLFPIGAVVMAAIMINSMIQILIFSRTEWRGRVYSVEQFSTFPKTVIFCSWFFQNGPLWP